MNVSGKTISNGVKKIKSQKAASYAHRLLGVRPRSERELRDRLFKKGFGQANVSEVVALLKEQNVIDDFKFAKLWVESRMRTAPKGDALLRKELRDKGVAQSIIDEALASTGESEVKVARDLATKQLTRLKGLPREKARKKLFDFLARRGFNFDTIRDIVREAYAE